MTRSALPDEAIVIGAFADDWRAAVHIAGEALVASQVALPGYSDEMIRMIEEHGAYVVIAPGLAFAHARPGDQVLRTGLSVVTLESPIAFGHPHNDPVHVVVALAVESVGAHLESIADVANVFNDPTVISRLSAATTPAEIRTIMNASA